MLDIIIINILKIFMNILNKKNCTSLHYIYILQYIYERACFLKKKVFMQSFLNAISPKD